MSRGREMALCYLRICQIVASFRRRESVSRLVERDKTCHHSQQATVKVALRGMKWGSESARFKSGKVEMQMERGCVRFLLF